MTPGDLLADLPVLIAAAEAGSFSAAASKLNVTRSAVGRSVARLEHRLGVRLFHRTTRSLALTDDGQIVFEHGKRALAEVQSVTALLDSGRRAIAGRLRVSMPVLFGRLRIAPILIRLADAHPTLELDLNFSDRLVDVVEDGFDLVVRGGRLQNWPGLTVRRIAYQPMRVCAAPRYLEGAGIPDSLADLSGHHAVLYGRPGSVRSWLFPQADGPATEIVPPSRMRFDDVGAIRDAAIGGHGLAWLPCWLIRDDVAAGRLATVLDHLPAHVFESHALWPQTPHLPLRVRLAIDALAAGLPEVSALRTESPARTEPA
ncbi:LysR family transcriptional regulator [Methylobacterium pseudosasicola]|uniref:Transcriptional regulator, LysR family n=1 Tax=Methylobacterium pseudosasicola TaxID=582667 RepID=A0A1I4LBP1_9HYPH|nr:LysR family transcriptional regulator [Methylobacterium pseudosasicola]SFL88057.1 transcriptional regulator, LysR family [Methylobacterium pseudosasicola]